MRKRLGTGREGASRTAAKTAVLPLEGAPRRSGTQDRLTHGFNASRALAAVLAVVAGVLLALPAEASRGGNPGLDLQAFSKPPELLSSVAQSSVAPRRSGEAIRFRLDGGVPRSLSESLEEAFVIVDLPEFEPAGIGAHELVELAPAGRTFEPRFERSILEGLGDRVTLGAKPPPCNGLCIYAWEERSTYSLRARWYDPRTAQFLSEDPLDDIDSPNVYGYVAGRPHEARDPWGLFELGDVWKGVKTYVEVGVDTTRSNLKSAAKLGLGMVDVAAGGRISGAVRALDSAASTKGSAGERLAAAYGAYERGKRATMSMGFSEAADKLQHAQDLVGVGGIDRGSSQLAEGILEGDLDKAGRGFAEFAGGVGQLAGTAASAYAPLAPTRRPALAHVDADPLRSALGPARLSHPEEFNSAMSELRAAGAEVDLRPGSMAYSPQTGGPGKLILDPEASVGALRHEMQHFRDAQAAGFPGFRPYYENPNLFWEAEYRAYMMEVRLARELRRFDLGRELVDLMRNTRKELIGK